MAPAFATPIQVEVEVGQTSPIEIDEDYNYQKKQKCNWMGMLKTGLNESYPDMRVKAVRKGPTIILTIKMPLRPRVRAEVESRIDEYLRHSQPMPIRTLRIK